MYGESIASLTEADNLVESRMSEVRLVFILSLVSLSVGALAMLAGIADTLLMLLGFVISAFVACHASMSDLGTVRLYEKYTGLRVNDRWSFDNIGTVVTDLARPFGFAEGPEERELLHDKADSFVAAISLQAARARSERVTAELGQQLHQSAKWATAKLSLFKQGTYELHESVLDRRPPKPGGPQPAAGTDHPSKPAMVGGALMLQQAWRERRAKRATDHVGWLHKTASGSGPIEKMREAMHAEQTYMPLCTKPALPP